MVDRRMPLLARPSTPPFVGEDLRLRGLSQRARLPKGNDMRQSFSERVERGRVTSGGTLESRRGDDFGFFHLTTNAGAHLGVMVSAGDDSIPWEHVSVSTRTRCPTWDEMCWVKSLFWDDEEVVVQYHPAKSAYVNYHPFCLHMYRPLAAELPVPPSITVGKVGAQPPPFGSELYHEDAKRRLNALQRAAESAPPEAAHPPADEPERRQR